MKGVLFLCVANSARSQIAEAVARARLPPEIAIFSAGSAPKSLHPLAARVLAEAGLDVSGLRSKHLSTIPLAQVDLVVTLCAEEVCPVVPAGVRRLRWPLPDPAAAGGDEATQLAAFRAVRDELAARIDALR